MKSPLFLAVLILAAISTAQAQVQVVDSSAQAPAPGGSSPNESSNRDHSNQQADLFYQLQSLQQEVMSLRGLVETQAYKLKKLKQRQKDNYLDLDRRVSALTTKKPSETAGQVNASANIANIGVANPSSSQASASALNDDSTAAQRHNSAADGDDTAQYNSAYNLLKQRKIDPSITAFKHYLDKFPSGQYADNSYYWLGEIYLLKNDLPAAQQWFGDLLDKFPDSRKVPDAQFKLGKVYHLLGQDERAKELLQIVAASDASASRLAKQYLNENFKTP